MSLCKSRTGETNPAGTLALDFQPPEQWENKFLLFKPSSMAFCFGILSKLIQRWRIEGTLKLKKFLPNYHFKFKKNFWNTLLVALSISVNCWCLSLPMSTLYMKLNTSIFHLFYTPIRNVQFKCYSITVIFLNSKNSNFASKVSDYS